MAAELRFRVYGEPAPQGSKRYLGNGRFIEASAKLKPWRAAVADAVFRKFSTEGLDVFTDPVIVEVTFWLPKPPSVRRLLPTVPPDLDKLCRGLGDALEQDAGVLASDSLIVRWVAAKAYAPLPKDVGADVIIRALSKDQQTQLAADLTEGRLPA